MRSTTATHRGPGGQSGVQWQVQGYASVHGKFAAPTQGAVSVNDVDNLIDHSSGKWWGVVIAEFPDDGANDGNAVSAYG